MNDEQNPTQEKLQQDGLTTSSSNRHLEHDVMALLESIRICEIERQTAQLSGLTTGFEHPNTMSAWWHIVVEAQKILGAP